MWSISWFVLREWCFGEDFFRIHCTSSSKSTPAARRELQSTGTHDLRYNAFCLVVKWAVRSFCVTNFTLPFFLDCLFFYIRSPGPGVWCLSRSHQFSGPVILLLAHHRLGFFCFYRQQHAFFVLQKLPWSFSPKPCRFMKPTPLSGLCFSYES